VSGAIGACGARVHLFRLDGSGPPGVEARPHVVTLIGRELGCTPAEVRLRHAPDGRPELAGGGLQISIAHTRGLGALAVHASYAVGVDVERMAALSDLPGLADVALSARETAWVLHAGSAERARRFLTLWTLKEAVVKAAGTGLDDPRSVEVLDAAAGSAVHPGRCRHAEADWRAMPLRAPAGYVAALAVAAAQDRPSPGGAG
jgi:4'-phosphopantetheinyl transferase